MEQTAGKTAKNFQVVELIPTVYFTYVRVICAYKMQITRVKRRTKVDDDGTRTLSDAF